MEGILKMPRLIKTELGKEIYINILKIRGLSDEQAQEVYDKVIEEIDKGNIPPLRKEDF